MKILRFLIVIVVLAVLLVVPFSAVLARDLAVAGSDGLFKVVVTPESLTIIFAGLLALAFDWFPRLSTWYDTLSPLKKVQLMIACLIGVTGAVFAGSCYGLFDTGLACSKETLPVLLEYILIAAGVNQGVHSLTKPR